MSENRPPPTLDDPYRALTDSELAIDWVRLHNEIGMLRIELYRERAAHMITVAVLVVETMLLVWMIFR